MEAQLNGSPGSIGEERIQEAIDNHVETKKVNLDNEIHELINRAKTDLTKRTTRRFRTPRKLCNHSPIGLLKQPSENLDSKTRNSLTQLKTP